MTAIYDPEHLESNENFNYINWTEPPVERPIRPIYLERLLRRWAVSSPSVNSLGTEYSAPCRLSLVISFSYWLCAINTSRIVSSRVPAIESPSNLSSWQIHAVSHLTLEVHYLRCNDQLIKAHWTYIHVMGPAVPQIKA